MSASGDITVKILFFGLTAEITSKRAIDIALPSPSSVSSAVERVESQFPELARHSLLVSLNERYAEPSETLGNGDTIGIFTAVSGG
jgi:molybdopterin converting factor small subunit